MQFGQSDGGRSSPESRSSKCQSRCRDCNWLVRVCLVLPLAGIAWLLDEPVFHWASNAEFRKGTSGFRNAAEQLGGPFGICIICLAVARLDPRHKRHLIVTIVGVIVASTLATQLKFLVGRERPKAASGATLILGPHWPWDRDSSFPSGHTAAAFALAYGLGRLYPHGRGFFVAGAIACGVSRVLSRVHFTTDAFVGAWIGWEIARLVWSVFDKHSEGLWEWTNSFQLSAKRKTV